MDRDAFSILSLESLIETSDIPLRVMGKASTVNEGLELLHGLSPDFLFLDIELEGNRTGMDLLNEWKPSGTKVILYTRRTELELSGILNGVTGMLIKPASESSLTSLITKALKNNS